MMSTTSSSEAAIRFSDLGLSTQVNAILDRARFVTPTPIQAQSIPVALSGQDVIGVAQTGTGKTLAFGLPVIEHLLKKGGRALIVLPTRELALQVDEVMQKIARPLGLRSVVLIGGASMQLQNQSLRMKPHILIVTPGRLIDHLEQRTMDLHDVRLLVLDEADRMLDMGFAPQMKKIFAVVPAERQTMLFSATMSPEITAITHQWMKQPIRVEIARTGTTADRVTQELFYVEKSDKIRLLSVLLGKHEGTFIVFSRTKHGAKKMTRHLRELGVTAAEIHANRSLSQRKEALDGFKRGKYRVLVATDIAARGIDVQGIGVVVNYDLPDQIEDYVHRIGRTGRAGLGGHAISFASRDQVRDVRSIERLIKKPLPVAPVPVLPVLVFKPMPEEPEYSGGFGGRGGQRSSGGRGGQRSSSFGSGYQRSDARREFSRPSAYRGGGSRFGSESTSSATAQPAPQPSGFRGRHAERSAPSQAPVERNDFSSPERSESRFGRSRAPSAYGAPRGPGGSRGARPAGRSFARRSFGSPR